VPRNPGLEGTIPLGLENTQAQPRLPKTWATLLQNWVAKPRGYPAKLRGYAAKLHGYAAKPFGDAAEPQTEGVWSQTDPRKSPTQSRPPPPALRQCLIDGRRVGIWGQRTLNSRGLRSSLGLWALVHALNPIPKGFVNDEGKLRLLEINIGRLGSCPRSAGGALWHSDLHRMSKTGRIRECDGPQGRNHGQEKPYHSRGARPFHHCAPDTNRVSGW
jgi:hypothetical protein